MHKEKEMKTQSFTLAGLAIGGAGLFLGMSMSSSIPSTPFIYGVAAAVYAAVAAAVFAGVHRRNRDITCDQE